MSRSSFKIGDLQLEVSITEGHEGKQPSKWDDVRHQLVHFEGPNIGKPNLDRKIEGFKTMSDASGCAARMRNTWGLQVKSYTNIKNGKFGICFKTPDDEEEAPATPAAVPVAQEPPVEQAALNLDEQAEEAAEEQE